MVAACPEMCPFVTSMMPPLLLLLLLAHYMTKCGRRRRRYTSDMTNLGADTYDQQTALSVLNERAVELKHS